MLAASQVLIDFTRPEGHAAPTCRPAAASAASPLVIGTTGFSAEQKARDRRRRRSTSPIVLAPNMSVGVNVVMRLLEQAADARSRDGYDIEIVEAHHRNKVDAPSGTALADGRGRRQALGRNPGR